MKRLAVFAAMGSVLLALAPAARADHGAVILGAAVGAVAGVIVGQELGGRDGAIIGGAIGGASGAAIATHSHYHHYRGPVVEAYAPVYVAAPPVYVAPRPVYLAPQPVYYTPPPVYYAPPPVYVGPPRYVSYRVYPRYFNERREWRFRRHHEHHRYD